MVYFTRTVPDALGDQRVEFAISIRENPEQVHRLEAQGFVSCSSEAFREAWRKKDAQAFERMQAAALMVHPAHG
jgi:hypothetical protein